jgi:ketosteroid isomerase-like protein
MNDNNSLIRNNPNEPASDAVNRTAQEILAALLAKDSAKVNSYYAPEAVIATSGRQAAKGGEAVSKAINDDIADPNFKMSLSNEQTEVAGVFRKQADGSWKVVEDFGV